MRLALTGSGAPGRLAAIADGATSDAVAATVAEISKVARTRGLGVVLLARCFDMVELLPPERLA
jgi:hypothetical protein